ncbi:energy transducer TonB [Alteromonas sp. CYL-A6]|uniref:energy transducer TonB n=1 Tax=Alteromonas nitratireducens TaxID=3390813 RepID=UPI0034AB1C32
MNTLAYETPASAAKPLFSLCSAVLITFGLFAVMAKLVETDTVSVDAGTVATIGPVTLQLEEQTTRIKTPVRPRPERVKTPPVQRPVPTETTPNDLNNTIGYQGPALDPPELDDRVTFSAGDQEVRPIVRVDPAYPAEAARDGIEGWVALRFTIDPLGAVRDIEIVDAAPKRIFDRAARRALAKWKYQPKRQDGRAISQPGMQVILEFSLQQ